jgi:hypothetical protein
VTVRLLDGRHGPKDFKLHRAILAQKSGYFRTLFLGNCKEASAKLIELSGDDEKAFDAMLRYIYGVPIIWNNWTSNDEEVSEDNQDASFYINLFKLATKYSIDGLYETLIEQLRMYVTNITTDPKLQEILRAVYTFVQKPGTDLGKTIAHAAARNPHVISIDADFAKLVIDIPILAADLMLDDIEHQDAVSTMFPGLARAFCKDCAENGETSSWRQKSREFSVQIRHDACGRTFPKLDFSELRQQMGASSYPGRGSSYSTRYGASVTSDFSHPGPQYGSQYGGSSDLGWPFTRSNSPAFGGSRSGLSSRASSPGFNSPPVSPRNRSRRSNSLSPARRPSNTPPPRSRRM